MVLVCSHFLVSEKVQAAVVLMPPTVSGLESYWTFDSKTVNWTSSTVSDVTGNGNDGTLVFMDQNTNKAAGKRGQAIFFDGSVNSISLATSPLLSISNPSTICTWAKTVSISDSTGGFDQTILNLFVDGNNGIRIGNITGSGAFFASYYVGGVYSGGQSTSQVFSNNIWTHVCYVWNGSGVTLYANGASVASTTNTNSHGSVSTIGARDDIGNGAWHGTIDDLRIYSRALTSTEILRIYQSGAMILNSSPGKTITIAKTPTNFLTNGLVGHWTFDGNKINWATNTALDSSGNGNNGSLINMSTTTSPAQGKVGQALYFDGSNDKMTTSYNSIFDFGTTNPFSVFAWVKVGSVSGSSNYAPIINKFVSGTYRGYFIQVSASPDDGKLYLGLVNSLATHAILMTGTASVNNDKWHHIGFTYDGSGVAAGVKLYIDGSVDATTVEADDLAGNTIASTVGVAIGTELSSVYTKASIDDARIYSHALTPSEVKQLYLMGK